MSDDKDVKKTTATAPKAKHTPPSYAIVADAEAKEVIVVIRGTKGARETLNPEP